MTEPLLDTVASMVQRHLGDDPHILVALSGGVDSCVLLDVLWRLRQRGLLQHLEALHVDHRLRPDSRRDARHCRRFAGARQIPINVVELHHRGSLSQAQARHRRLSALADQAYQVDAHAIALGHHGDDRIETALLNARRGSGLDGLASMSALDTCPLPGPSLPLFRPLIDHLKSDLQTYASSRKIDPIIDSTNASDAYARNELRHRVIPDYLRTPAERRRFLRSLDNLDAGRQAADRHLHALRKRASLAGDGDLRAHHFALSPLQEAPDATVARLLLSLLPGLDHSHLETLLDAIESPPPSGTPRHLSLPGSLSRITDERISLQPAFSRGARDILQRPIEPICLGLESGQAYFFGFSIRWEHQSPDDKPLPPTPWGATLALETDAQPLILGAPRTGEQIHRLHDERSFHQPLKTWLGSQSIPQRFRSRWPCVYDGDGDLRWVAGRPHAEPRSNATSPPSRIRIAIQAPREIIAIFQP